MASKARKKYQPVRLSKAAEEDAYYMSGEWLAKRAAEAGKSLSEFGVTVQRETEKFATYFPHPFEQVLLAKMDRYRQHLWRVFIGNMKQGA
jgi:hypothetical protein